MSKPVKASGYTPDMKDKVAPATVGMGMGGKATKAVYRGLPKSQHIKVGGKRGR